MDVRPGGSCYDPLHRSALQVHTVHGSMGARCLGPCRTRDMVRPCCQKLRPGAPQCLGRFCQAAASSGSKTQHKHRQKTSGQGFLLKPTHSRNKSAQNKVLQIQWIDSLCYSLSPPPPKAHGHDNLHRRSYGSEGTPRKERERERPQETAFG